MVRLLTYNVHHCRGQDGKVSPERIADVIAAAGPQIAVLQEVDVGRRRSGIRDQAQIIADRLNMQPHFHAAIEVGEERYGNAILSTFPFRIVHAGRLPSVPWIPYSEPRSALWATVTIEDAELQLFSTHLGLTPVEQRFQIDALLGHEWLKSHQKSGPQLLAGDFNAGPGSLTYRRLTHALRDARVLSLSPATPTFPAIWPRLTIDHIFVNSAVDVSHVETVANPLARIASDHLPLLAEFKVQRDA